jgi:uncharacterized protein YndB with AHSA1/START domain
MSEHSDANSDAQILVFESDLDEPREKVWKALTDAKLLAAWLLANDFAPEPGRHFTLRGNTKAGEPDQVDCQVLELEPLRRISYSWRESGGDARSAPSIVTFWLIPLLHGGTRLRLIHRSGATMRGISSLGGMRCAA